MCVDFSSFADFCVCACVCRFTSRLIYTLHYVSTDTLVPWTVDYSKQAVACVDVVGLFRVWVDGHACMMNERGLLHAAALLDGRGVVSLSCS